MSPDEKPHLPDALQRWRASGHAVSGAVRLGMEGQTMDEKAMEQRLCEELRSGRADSTRLRTVLITNSTSEARTLLDLVGNRAFDVFQDTSDWNTHPGLMMDIVGGMTPDVVLRSAASGENRIIIEVKRSQALNYGLADSQVVRYFLHMLATSSTKPKMLGSDIGRAILLAAPSQWFEEAKNATACFKGQLISSPPGSRLFVSLGLGGFGLHA